MKGVEVSEDRCFFGFVWRTSPSSCGEDKEFWLDHGGNRRGGFREVATCDPEVLLMSTKLEEFQQAFYAGVK